ncbi:MAG: ribosome biogenesis factor YjgA [Deefgea sp.]
MANPNQYDSDEPVGIISKSQAKREATELQKLGTTLLEYTPKQLLPLNLPENLLQALKEGRKITANVATARQKQYIGKLMRNIDPAPIYAFLDAQKGITNEHNIWLHQIERLRERMITDAKAVEKFISDYPEVDIQYLRQLIRNAQKERQQQEAGKHIPPKAFRELFQLMKTFIKEPAVGYQDEESHNEESNEE